MSLSHIQNPFSLAMTKVIQRMVQDAVQLAGKALPVRVESRSGAFVTISFQVSSQWTIPHLTVPILMSPYVRLPIKAGDVGVVIPFDARLSSITGQGGIAPGLDQPGNLSALAFIPIGSKDWPTEGSDTNLILYSNPDCLVQVTPTGVTVTGSSGKVTAAGQIEGGSLKADNGWSGTFATGDSRVVTVANGIITNVV